MAESLAGFSRLSTMTSPSVHTASSLRFGKRRSTAFSSWIVVLRVSVADGSQRAFADVNRSELMAGR